MRRIHVCVVCCRYEVGTPNAGELVAGRPARAILVPVGDGAWLTQLDLQERQVEQERKASGCWGGGQRGVFPASPGHAHSDIGR